MSHQDLATVPSKGVISAHASDDVIAVPAKPHQMMTTKRKTGQLEITASLKTSGSYLIGGFGSISDTLSVRLVNDASITPEQVPKAWFTLVAGCSDFAEG